MCPDERSHLSVLLTVTPGKKDTLRILLMGAGLLYIYKKHNCRLKAYITGRLLLPAPLE